MRIPFVLEDPKSFWQAMLCQSQIYSDKMKLNSDIQRDFLQMEKTFHGRLNRYKKGKRSLS